MKRNLIIKLLLVVWLASPARGGAVVSLASSVSLVSSITENFDSMGAAGTAPPAGWSMKLASGSNTTWTNSVPISSAGVATMVATTGSLTASSTPATTNSNGFNAQGASSADRVLATSPTGVAGVAIQLQLTNSTGTPLSTLKIGYDIRRFTAAGTANELPGYWLFYSLDSGATWTNVAALNPALSGGGVLVPNTVGVTVVPVTTIALSGSWASGTDLLLRWVDDNAAATSPDQIIGLDNVSVIAPPVVGAPPSVTLTAPANNSTYSAPASITLAASAGDSDGSIARVEFFQGSTKLGEDTLAPYTLDWSAATGGTYSLTARATDNDGNVAVSPAVTVFVNSLTRGPYLQKAAPTAMTVRWRSSQPGVGRVRIGSSPANLTAFTDEADATTEHEVALNGLTPGTLYFYSVGSSAGTLAGGDATCTFTTSPIPGAAANTRVWVLGDAGTGTAGQFSVRDAFYTWTGSRTPDLVLQLGDNAYNSGLDSEFQTRVFDVYGTLMRKSPFWSCLGNHETAQSTSFVDTYPYFSIYSFPKAGECGGVTSGTEHYFSWDYGNIHFISLDSMTASRSASGAMATWLTNDLASTTATWVIAIWHHPPYTKGSHDSDTATESIEMRETFLPILEAGGVDLVLCGHSHCYERSYLLDGHYGLAASLTAEMIKNSGDGRQSGNGAYGKPLTGNHSHFGAVYCVTGSAGQTSGGSLDHPAHFISLSVLGSTVLDINGAALNATFLRETGAVDDSFSIVKQGGSTPPIVTTLAATAVTSTSATLRGSVNPTGTAATAKFRHGLSSSYGIDTALTLSPNDGLSSQAVSATIAGLAPGVTYHFQVTASNAWGTSSGSDVTFTTQTPFEEWISGQGLSGPDAAASADAESDGKVNLVEWAFGTDPTVGDASELKIEGAILVTRGGPRIQFNGAAASATFCRRKDFASAGLTYTIQFSADLAVWEDVAGAPVAIAGDDQIEAVSVPFPASVNGGAPKFFRLVISAQ